MKKNLLALAALLAGAYAHAQCEAVATLNEDFSDFTIGTSNVFPQNCWSANAGMPMIYTAQAGEPANQYVVYYNMNSAGAAGYLVTPELSSIDGNHQLSFSTFKIAGPGGTFPTAAMTVQVGTLANATDFASFQAVGEPIEVTNEPVTHDEIAIAASTTQKYIVFKIIGTGAHNGVGIDNVVWDEVPAPPCEAVATLNEDFSDFTIGTSNVFPQNCWSANAGMPMIYTAQAGDPANPYVVYYNMNSAGAPGYLVTPELSTIDGNHQLSFSTFKIAGPGGTFPTATMTVQVGTLANPADFASFQAVGEPIEVTNEPVTHDEIVIAASTTQKYIVFKIIGTGAHNGVGIDNVVWNEVPALPCEAVATLNEDFADFTPSFDVISENCWSANAGAPLFYIDSNEEATDNYVTFYAAGTADTAGYLITPELTTIDGNHNLSFDAFAVGNPAVVTTVQVGTVAGPDDLASFQAVGEAFTVTAESVTYDEIVIPATAHRYIAFRMTTNNAHGAAGIDNVVWQENVAGIDELNRNYTFSFYPNPSADKNVTFTNNTNKTGKVNIYSLTGAKVFETELNGNLQNVNLSTLTSGMYIVKFETGNYSESHKLVIK